MIKKLIFIICIGAVLEFYDFALLMMLLTTLSDVFLPEMPHAAQWFFALYAASSMTRPIGGLVFSHFGDTVGRKQLFRLSIIMMSLATLGIGLLPSYATAGLTGFILLTLLRCLQGFSVGGELPGAIVFATEHISPQHRGVMTAAIIASAILGIVLASSTGLFLNHWLTPAQLIDWGWRLPFFLGSLLGVLGYFMRRGITETPVFKCMLEKQLSHRIPLLTLLQQHPRNLLIGIGLSASAAILIAFYTYLIPYAQKHLGYSAFSTYTLHTTTLLTLSLLTLAMGRLSDRTGRKCLLLAGGVVLFAVAWPASVHFNQGTIAYISLLTLIPIAIANGCYQAAIIELFDTPVRYTGVALSVNIGVGLFGGATPFLLEYCFQHTFVWGPLLLLFSTALMAIISSVCIQKPFGQPLAMLN